MPEACREKTMILDARNVDEIPPTIAGETVIIGAGTVGLFLAICLARMKMPVLLIEAGGHVANTSCNGETAESVGKPNSCVLIGRASGLGGTSVLWGGQLAEFDEADLVRPGFEWPLNYDELRQWYDYVYGVLGLARRPSKEGCRKILGGETEISFNIDRFFTFWLSQPNFAALFRGEIMFNPLIRLVLNATVNDIVLADACAEAALATSTDGRRIRIVGKKFVFAAGVIANSRFFLATQRVSAVPWRFNQFIGKYFQDHLGGKIADIDVLDVRKFREFFENGFINKIKLQPKLKLTQNVRAEVLSGVSGMFGFNSAIGEHIANVKRTARALKLGLKFSALNTLPSDMRKLIWAFAPLLIRYVRDRRVLAFFDRGVELHVQAEQLPVSNSHIRLLDKGLGRDGLFRAGVDWRVDGREIEAIRRFAIEADSYLQARGIGRLRVDRLIFNNDSGFLEQLGSTAHMCGGMRMAPAPSRGVTDLNCRVWDTANVYVAGASLFPTSSHANCTLTALALTARLAITISKVQ
jgi:choline dehydrogenase-like flavoprotein